MSNSSTIKIVLKRLSGSFLMYIELNKMKKKITVFVLDRSQDQPRVYTWPNLHRLKAPYSKEHVNLCAPCHTEVRPRARITQACSDKL